MKIILKWILKYKGALYVSGAYGVVAIFIYILGILSGKDGPVGAWMLIYYSAWPISYLFAFTDSLVEGILPDNIDKVVFAVGPILVGMLWYFLISRCFFSIRAKLRAAHSSSHEH